MSISHFRIAGLAAITTAALTLGLPSASAAGSGAVVKDTVVTHVTDSVRIYFPQNKAALNPDFGGNPASFRLLDGFLSPGGGWSLPKTVRFVGAASPEGSVKYNYRLSAKRAKTVTDYLTGRYDALSSVNVETSFVGRDWEGLLTVVRADPAVPFKSQTVALLEEIVANVRANGEKDSDNNVARLQNLKDGAPYYYLNEFVFPILRSTRLVVSYDLVRVVEREEAEAAPAPVVPAPQEEQTDFVPRARRNFYMDISTNMLYDLAMTPNVGAEFYLGRRWSLQADWMYAWWRSDSHSFYWRTYGGDFTVRKWIGRKAKEKPLQGHHLGIYGQMMTYDFEFGGNGYLADKWNWGAGLEYGYSLPVAPRLNIDFSLGVGYIGGQNKLYDPEDGHYYWDETKRVHYVGPTRLEISLVWLIGRGNYNPIGRKAGK